MRTEFEQKTIRLSGSSLKLIACISMLADHSAKIFGFTGAAELLFCDVIGRLAFPIFAFLLTEGFQHTGNFRKYFSGLLLFALLSEIPYDLTVSEAEPQILNFTHQNTLFTLCLGLLMLACIKKAETLLYSKASAYTLISLADLTIVISFAFGAQFLKVDYGFIGIACIGAMYLCRMDTLRAAFFGCVCLNLEFFSIPGAFLSLIPLSAYDGTRGKQRKYFFYLFYPLHLLFLGAINLLVM